MVKYYVICLFQFTNYYGFDGFVYVQKRMGFFQMQKCIQVDQKLMELDREITVNPQYVQKVS